MTTNSIAQKMKILVTGGAGYIGSITVKQLILQKHEVIIFDNLSTGDKKLINPHAKFIQGDIQNLQTLKDTFKNHTIDAVIHLAAVSSVHESTQNPQKYFKTNISGTQNILKAMNTFQCKLLIFSSTAAVFGNPIRLPINENHPTNPINPYGESKKEAENLIKKNKHIHSTILRYFNAAGADHEGQYGEIHEPESHLIPIILKSIQNQEEVKIFGADYNTPDGTCIRDYIHVEDIASAHVKALQKLITNKESNTFNLGSEKGHSVKEVIQTCFKITGIKSPVVTESRRTGDPPTLIASHTKAKKKLNWSPTKNLEDMVKDAWSFEKSIKTGKFS
jgi:UDP-glucose 4-epimerase